MTLTSREGCVSIRARAVVAAHIRRVASRSTNAHIDRFAVILPSLPGHVRWIADGHRQASVQSEVSASAVPHSADNADASRG